MRVKCEVDMVTKWRDLQCAGPAVRPDLLLRPRQAVAQAATADRARGAAAGVTSALQRSCSPVQMVTLRYTAPSPARSPGTARQVAVSCSGPASSPLHWEWPALSRQQELLPGQWVSTWERKVNQISMSAEQLL